eukprot:129180_1
MSTANKAYNAEIPERPTEILELRPFDDGTNRGCKIIDMNEDIAHEGWAQVIQCPSKIISIAGERITGYTFKTISKMLTRCALPVRVRLEPTSSFRMQNISSSKNRTIPVSSDSESEADNHYRNKSRKSNHMTSSSATYNQKRSTYNKRYNKAQKYRVNGSTKKPPKLRQVDSNDSQISIHLGSPNKSCTCCRKALKESKQHRCRRCAAIICSKCSKHKRKEVSYNKLVRVCDNCITRDEFSVQIKSKPLGIQIGPLYGKTNDIGGILIIGVKDGGGIQDCQMEEDVSCEKTVIIAIGKEEYKSQERMKNIELLAYNEAIEVLRTQPIPFYISCKKWNRNTKKSAKEQLEKEHQQLIQQTLAEMQRMEEEKKTKKKPKHRRTGTDSSFASNKSDHESPTASRETTPREHGGSMFSSNPMDLFGKTASTNGRYTGTNEIEDHPAMELIRLAQESEKNDDMEAAAAHYENAIKQFNSTINEIDNNKIKRTWREKVNDYEIQKLRVNRKLRLRKKINSTSRRGRKTAASRRGKKVDYTSDMKSEAEKAKGGGGGDGDAAADKEKKKPDQDAQFKARLEADIVTEKPNVSFQDVMGLANVKLAIYETVILPQKRPELFTGLRAPAMGLLLFGPPGNGKTMIAKCVATEIDSTFFSISASSITSKWVGEAERIMRTLFGLAREKAPSIIFIDEIDSLLTARGGNNEAESSRRIKTEFLVQFDGVHSAKDLEASILVIGATNLPDQLDEAVLRRFSKRILVPHPEYETRYGLVRTLMKDEPHTLTQDDFVRITKASDRYSCSDLAHLCKDAALGPLREMGAVLVEDDFDESNLPKTQIKHFENSLKNVRSSLSKESLTFYRNWDKKFGSKFHLKASELPEFLRPKPIEPLV